MSDPRTKHATLDEADIPDAPHLLPPARELGKSLGVDTLALVNARLNDVTKLLWFHRDASEAQINTQVTRAIELYESLDPADGAEGMLATQMVGTHFAALECLRRANVPEQTFAGRDMALKHAQKLMALYTQQLAALNKHRGKGQQKVTVEHVHVEAGGQAIVGNVEAAPRPRKVSSPPALTEGLEVPLELPPARKKLRKS